MDGNWSTDGRLAELALFFFTSRRRHTRFDCDWSSDVCSSDLHVIAATDGRADRAQLRKAGTVEDRNRRVLERRIELAGLHLAQRVGVAVVGDDFRRRLELLARVGFGGRAGQYSDLPLARRGLR